MRANRDFETVEQLLYAQLVPDSPQIKIAMLVARAFHDNKILTDETVDLAMSRLVLRHDIQSFGVIRNWRHSEIKRRSKSAT